MRENRAAIMPRPSLLVSVILGLSRTSHDDVPCRSTYIVVIDSSISSRAAVSLCREGKPPRCVRQNCASRTVQFRNNTSASASISDKASAAMH